VTTFFIGGYYGAGNLGDEAILECMLHEFRSIREDSQFIVTSWNPEQTQTRYAVEAVSWKNFPALFRAIQRSDLAILGGGGLFQDYWGIDPSTYLSSEFRDISAYGSIPLLAKLSGLPSMTYAIGLGPFLSEAGLRHTQFALDNCDLVTLRDEDSLSLLFNHGDYPKSFNRKTVITADPVFNLLNTPEDRIAARIELSKSVKAEPENLLGIVLRGWDFSGQQSQWVNSVAQGVRLFLDANEFFKVVLLPFQVTAESSYTNDDAVLDAFSADVDLPGRIFRMGKDISPKMMQALIGQCDLLLTMRLHGSIMAINSGTPCVGLPYDPKVPSLFSSAGLDDCCCSTLNVEPSHLSDRLTAALANRESIRESMHIFREHSKEKAKANAILAFDLAQSPSRESCTILEQITFQQTSANVARSEQITVLSMEIDLLKEQIESTGNAFEEQCAENIRLNKLIEWQEKENQILSDVVDETRRQRTALEGELEAQSRQNQSLKVENETFRTGNRVLSDRIAALQNEIHSRNQELNTIYSSKAWSLVRLYYTEIDRPPLKTVRRWIRKSSSAVQSAPVDPNPGDQERFLAIIRTLNNRSLKGIFILTSTVRFDPSSNQRVVNLAKYLSKTGWGVIFVAWRWSSTEPFDWPGEEIIPNGFQIPIDVFIDLWECCSEFEWSEKYLVLEFPHPDFLALLHRLRAFGFRTAYDIIDDWEEFNQVDQAPWYQKEFEDALLYNADAVMAVSQPLMQKFQSIRKDIRLVPNGFSPRQIGIRHRNIALRKKPAGEIRIGYFGHLTESWFDWELIFAILDLDSRQGNHIMFQIIGCATPDLKARAAPYERQLLLPGPIPPEQLYRYAGQWDLAMIPFRKGRLAEAVDPIKLYEYTYFGLPVIVSGITHLGEMANVRVVNDAAEFLRAAEAMRDEQHTRRQNAAPDSGKPRADLSSDEEIRQSTWEVRFEPFMEHLQSKKWIF
jgi:polysaccharide pyruvyl transferase CsaB